MGMLEGEERRKEHREEGSRKRENAERPARLRIELRSPENQGYTPVEPRASHRSPLTKRIGDVVVLLC